MRITENVLLPIISLCLCLGMAACSSDSITDNDSSSVNNDTASQIASADNTSSNIAATNSDNDIAAATVVTYVREISVEEETKGTDTVKITCTGDKVFGIIQTVTADSSEWTEDMVKDMDLSADEMFNNIVEGKDFAHYSRTNSQGVYTIVVSFTNLDVAENAEYLNILQLYNGYYFNVAIEEFEQALVEAGYAKVD